MRRSPLRACFAPVARRPLSRPLSQVTRRPRPTARREAATGPRQGTGHRPVPTAGGPVWWPARAARPVFRLSRPRRRPQRGLASRPPRRRCRSGPAQFAQVACSPGAEEVDVVNTGDARKLLGEHGRWTVGRKDDLAEGLVEPVSPRGRVRAGCCRPDGWPQAAQARLGPPP